MMDLIILNGELGDKERKTTALRRVTAGRALIYQHAPLHDSATPLIAHAVMGSGPNSLEMTVLRPSAAPALRNRGSRTTDPDGFE